MRLHFMFRSRFVYAAISKCSVLKTIIRRFTLVSMASHIRTTSPKAVHYAKELISYGEVIALPTDTVYGLACNATDAKAINNLYTIKGRCGNKPLAICVGKVDDVKRWARIDHLPEGLLASLLPGPVTLVLNSTSQLENSLTSSEGKIGIRIPNNGFVTAVLEQLSYPLALTSANTSGNPSSISISEFRNLWPQLACVFDHGILGTENNREASTVVDLSYSGFYKVLRAGIASDQTRYILNSHGLEDRQ